MIYVDELKPPIKLSGLSSFSIRSDIFNPHLKELFDNINAKYVHRNKGIFQFYEIGIDELKNVLDDLVMYDQITLKLALDTEETNTFEKITNEEIEYLRFTPYNHQIEAINYGLEHKKWLLLDSMGLGKTLEIIGLAEILKKRKLIDHCLIICGVNSVKENWITEIKKFGNSSCTILGKKIGKKGGVSYATVKECIEIIKKPIEEFFVVTNIEKLRDEKLVKAIKDSKNKFGMIAVDEIHRCSNKSSSQGSGLLKLDAPYLVGATGTLITNSPLSAYLPLVWTKNDKSNLGTYKAQYLQYSDTKSYEVIGYKNLGVLKEELQSCSLRRTLLEVRKDMPPKTIEYENIEMDKDLWDFYKGIKYQIVEELRKVDKVQLSANNLLANVIRLRQAVTCPSILTSDNITPTKLNRCVEIVEELIAQDEKVVILTNFVQPVKELSKILEKYHPLTIIGANSAEEREINKNLFQNDQNYKVIIGTHQAMGTGLTLNAAMYMIMLDTPYTASSMDQSCDRIYRINNERPAFIKVLNCKYSIDERVKEIVEGKRALGEFFENQSLNMSQVDKETLYNMLCDDEGDDK